MTNHLKSHADYLSFDLTTDEGRRALAEQLEDDAITFWEPFEALRDPRAVQRQRIDCCVMHNTFAREFLDTTASGAPIVKPELKDFGPLAVLVMQALPFLGQARLGHIFAALDAVREARDRRKGVAVVEQRTVSAPTEDADESIVEIIDIPDEDEHPRRVGSRQMVP